MNPEQNAPDPLFDLCCRYCLKHPETFCTIDGATRKFTLKQDVTLPKEICEKMVNLFCEVTGRVLDDDFITLFEDTVNTRLERINMSNSEITDGGIEILLKHKLVELDVGGCTKLTSASLELFNARSEFLTKLIVGATPQIFPESLISSQTSDTGDPTASFDLKENVYTNRGYILSAPALKTLKINSLSTPLASNYFSLLLSPLTTLTHLDLSSCFQLGKLDCLAKMHHLVSLVLFNVRNVKELISVICCVKTLRHLDISQMDDKCGVFRNPNAVLRNLCDSLPLLTSLDISGTNLAGTGVADLADSSSSSIEDKCVDDIALTDIPGLADRVSNPLTFLGLFDTSYDACHRHHIPAVHVSGTANEQQVLTAVRAYCDRPDYLRKALNELFRIFRYEMCQDQQTALQLILKGMNNQVNDRHIQISGSASLFYIVKSAKGKFLNCKTRKKVVKILLDAMTEHRYETTMIRNGCLTLCHLSIPQDVLFEYERLVRVLLMIISEDEQDEFVQRIGIYLVNSLACQVEGFQKQLVGDLGAIETMLKLIEERLARNLCDDVMEIAWSSMWNVTDETATNCQRFLDGRGMDLFMACLMNFPSKPQLLRNMMGLLGNVAEVQHLRPQLMKSNYIQVFSQLLDDDSDGIEVSYNAAGILSHIASDGSSIWSDLNLSLSSRQEMLARLEAAINRWDVNATRNINYRSFEPIIRLLNNEHSREAQYWAVWALTNLTMVSPEKYCTLLEDEGGVELLIELLQVSGPLKQTKELAKNVIKHCEQFAEFKEYHLT